MRWRNDRPRSPRRRARCDHHAGARLRAADAGGTGRRRGHFIVSGADANPGNDSGFRSEDSCHFHRHAGRAAVHGRRAAGAHDATRGEDHGGLSRRKRMQVDVSFLPAYGAAFMLMFARIGTMIMLLPGLGEMSVPARVRLTVALVLTLVLFPLHRAGYTIDLRAPGPVIIALAQELLIGVMLGLTARLTISALQVAGSVIAQQLGLGFVTAIDPTQGQQGLILGNFLTILGLTLIFATDLHHLVIAALNDSYTLFQPGDVPAIGAVAALTTRTLANAFRVGVQLSAPFLVFGLMFNIGLGVLSRLMPQMQVFFVALPLSILAGFLIFLLADGAMMIV